jgi:hypothetical protein
MRAVVFAILLIAGCASSSRSTTSTTSTTVASTTATSTTAVKPGAVAALLASVDAKPVLLPTMDESWTADVAARANTFTVTYTSDRGKQVRLAIEIANPGPGTAHVTQRQLSFRGDPKVTYQVDDATVPTSHRWILWREPGTWQDAGEPQWTGGPPYDLSADGLTDAEFWAIANSLTPIH